MIYTLLIIVIIFESFLLLRNAFKKNDGRLEIDEARDSYTIAITEDPERIKKKKHLKIKVLII